MIHPCWHLSLQVIFGISDISTGSRLRVWSSVHDFLEFAFGLLCVCPEARRMSLASSLRS